MGRELEPTMSMFVGSDEWEARPSDLGHRTCILLHASRPPTCAHQERTAQPDNSLTSRPIP
jgi:hypothetical protein